MSGSPCVLKGTAKKGSTGSGVNSDPKKCTRCNRSGHLTNDCRAPKCNFCSRIGHVDTKCFKNPASSSYKETAGVT